MLFKLVMTIKFDIPAEVLKSIDKASLNQSNRSLVDTSLRLQKVVYNQYQDSHAVHTETDLATTIESSQLLSRECQDTDKRVD